MTGWSDRLTGALPDDNPLGQLQENRRFRESFARLWSRAREEMLTDGGRRDTWLIAECANYPGPLQVSGVPYNNRAGLLLVRLSGG